MATLRVRNRLQARRPIEKAEPDPVKYCAVLHQLTFDPKAGGECQICHSDCGSISEEPICPQGA